MWRGVRILRAAAPCPYAVLGVPRTASASEIKKAFREAAKTAHPDATSGMGSNKKFRDLVEAYRILRDPKLRDEHERKSSARSEGFGGAHAYSHVGNRDGTRGPRPRDSQEIIWVPAAFTGMAFLYLFSDQKRGVVQKSDPYPQRLPSNAVNASVGAASKAPPIEDSRVDGSKQKKAPPQLTPYDLDVSHKVAPAIRRDELTSAYYNPYSRLWHRIPEGYEAPGPLDLTEWHKRHTDSVEWSRLFANGTLAEIQPRGALRVRFRPVWETHPPILLGDPTTGKTISAQDAAPRVQEVCDVRF